MRADYELRACMARASVVPSVVRVADCRLSEAERQELDDFFVTDQFEASPVKCWCERPSAPSDRAALRVLQHVMLPLPAPVGPPPSWMPVVCWNRISPLPFSGKECLAKLKEQALDDQRSPLAGPRVFGRFPQLPVVRQSRLRCRL